MEALSLNSSENELISVCADAVADRKNASGSKKDLIGEWLWYMKRIGVSKVNGWFYFKV